MIRLRVPEELSFNPSPIRRMPYRNMDRPPKSINTLKIFIVLSFLAGRLSVSESWHEKCHIPHYYIVYDKNLKKQEKVPCALRRFLPGVTSDL
jgi:hypothetical protein